MNSEKDPIMQNINVLIKINSKEAEKAKQKSAKLDQQLSKVTEQLNSLQGQLTRIEEKEAATRYQLNE